MELSPWSETIWSCHPGSLPDSQSCAERQRPQMTQAGVGAVPASKMWRGKAVQRHDDLYHTEKGRKIGMYLICSDRNAVNPMWWGWDNFTFHRVCRAICMDWLHSLCIAKSVARAKTPTVIRNLGCCCEKVSKRPAVLYQHMVHHTADERPEQLLVSSSWLAWL